MEKPLNTHTGTCFKAIVYFKQKPNNDFFSYLEIEQGKHIRRMGSYDTRRGKNKKVIVDHKDAFRKQVKMIEQAIHSRYTTAFIVINNYKGFTIAVRKYINDRPAFIMDVQFYELDQATGHTVVYSIPAADNLIDLYHKKQLSEAQKKLIKPIDYSIPNALPFAAKQIKTAA